MLHTDSQDLFSNIKACVFDAYGTLLDVHSAAALHSKRLGNQAQAVSELWRVKQLQYTWLLSMMRRYEDFWIVTGNALDFALQSHQIKDDQLRSDLMDAYLNLSCFEEVPQILRRLRESEMTTAILSNGSPRMLDPVIKMCGVSNDLDVCLSVDSIAVYKPDPRVYEMACERLEVAPDEIAFMSSNCWDAIGAAEYGFQVIWVNRYQQQMDRLPASPDAEISDLNALPGLLGLN